MQDLVRSRANNQVKSLMEGTWENGLESDTEVD